MIVALSKQLRSVVFVKLIPLSEETLLSTNITSPEQSVTCISVSDTTESLTPLFALSKYNFFKLPLLNGIEMFIPNPFKASWCSGPISGVRIDQLILRQIFLARLEATFSE
jgi:hypothetical protein